jgi:hypothetical protein
MHGRKRSAEPYPREGGKSAAADLEAAALGMGRR